MPVVVTCTNAACKKSLAVPDAVLGKRIKCPACGTIQTAAGPAPKPLPAGAPPASKPAAAPPPPAPKPVPPPAPPTLPTVDDELEMLPEESSPPVLKEVAEPSDLEEIPAPKKSRRPGRRHCPWCDARVYSEDVDCPECGRALDAEDTDVPYPNAVFVAGIIWIVFGIMILVNMSIVLLATFVLSSATGFPGFAGAGICIGVVVGLFGAAFLFVGVQSVRGTARDTLGNGIGSIVFAGLVLIGGLVKIAAGPNWEAVMAIAECGGLLSAGVLALVARAEYKRWRRVSQPQKRRPRRNRDQDDE